MSVAHRARVALFLLTTALLILCFPARPTWPTSHVAVLMVQRKVPVFDLIRAPEVYFKVRALPPEQAPRGALVHLDQVRNQRFNRPLHTGQVVTADDLLDLEQLGGRRTWRPALRAVEVPVHYEEGATALAPGSRVDVVLVPASEGPPSPRTVLEDARVLRVQRPAPTAEGAARTWKVTVQAMPEQAMRLFLAQTNGELRLRIRSPAPEAPQRRP
jgi:Flp pilus assembly protein CpaB